MKKALRWVLGIVGALLAIVVVLVVFKNSLLRSITEHRVEKETGLDASIGEFDLDLSSATVRISDFKLHNPAGFGGGALLEMPELYLSLDREAAASGPIRFHEARIVISELNVVKNAAGETNLFMLHKRLSRPRREKKKSDREFGGFRELHVTVGKVRYRDLANPANNQEFDIGVKDEVVTTIKNEKDLETWANAFLLRIVIQQAVLKSTTDPRFLEMFRRPGGKK